MAAGVANNPQKVSQEMGKALLTEACNQKQLGNI
jgi:hypothetical protein